MARIRTDHGGPLDAAIHLVEVLEIKMIAEREWLDEMLGALVKYLDRGDFDSAHDEVLGWLNSKSHDRASLVEVAKEIASKLEEIESRRLASVLRWRTLEVCSNCYEALHYGADEHVETAGGSEWFHAFTSARAKVGRALVETCPETYGDCRNSDGECLGVTFSKVPCDLCDTHLAGARHHVALDLIDEEAKSEFACDHCGIDVPDGEGRYVGDERVCAICSKVRASDRCDRCGDVLEERGERDGTGLCHECYCEVRAPR